MKKETLAIRNQTERTQYLEHSTPLFLTSSFIFEDAEDMRASFAEEKDRNIYSRFSNPNVSEFIEKMVLLDLVLLLHPFPGKAIRATRRCPTTQLWQVPEHTRSKFRRQRHFARGVEGAPSP